MANTLTFANLSLTDAHIFGGISFQHDINAGEEFTIGNTASASVTFVTDTQLPLYTNDAVNGTFTWTKGDTARGRFYITEVTKAAGKYTITAYDAMILLDTNISALSVSLPATVSELASAIATYCGCTVSGTIVNGSLSVSSLDADMTIRQLLTYIAEASGCSVKIDGSDHLCFMYYVDSGITITSSDYITLEVADYVCAAIDNVTIFNSTGEIQATYGSGGNSLYIGQNPFLENATNANAQAIYAKVSGITYAPLKAELFDESGLEIGTIATFGTTPTLVMHIDSSEGGANVSSVGSDNRAGYNKNAVVIANEARAIAIDTQSIASAASGLLSDMQAAATAAGTTLEGIYADAESAVQSAEQAQRDASTARTSAETALSSANSALLSLSQVESVLDVLNWVAEHGKYELTTDTTVVSGKTYYTVVGTAVASPAAEDLPTYYEMTSGHYVKTADTSIVSGKTYYTVVGTPVTPDQSQIRSYYELVVSEAIANYISTHLALTDDGLYVMADDSEWKVLVASDGVYIIDPNGNVVAKYKDSIVIGKDDGTQSYQVLDYHSLRLYDRSRSVYFHVSDLRDDNNEYEFQGYSALSDGLNRTIYLPLTAKEATYTVTVSDGSGGTPTKTITKITFETIPTTGAVITIGPYITSDSRAKAFTFGSRSGNVAPMSSTLGRLAEASGVYSHAEGYSSIASGQASHAEGDDTEASGADAHAEGDRTTASGQDSHAEGQSTTASGEHSHSEGVNSTASGLGSHAEGNNTTAGPNSAAHSEGTGTIASGMTAHAEGYYSEASAPWSHAQNNHTIAAKYAQTALGKYNIEDTASGNYGQYAFIIGNGESSSARSNALAVTWDGDIEFAVNTSATTGVDADLYSALSALGWE